MPQHSNDFDEWNEIKKQINCSDKKRPYFREGEIRWAKIGKNVKTEIIGKGASFTRPVLIFKKLYGNSCLAIPLTSKPHSGSYYFSFEASNKETFLAIFSQIKYLDGSRVGSKITTVNKSIFRSITNAFLDFIQKNSPNE